MPGVHRRVIIVGQRRVRGSQAHDVIIGEHGHVVSYRINLRHRHPAPQPTGQRARSPGDEAVRQHSEELSGVFVDFRGPRLAQFIATEPAGEQGDAG